MTYPIAPPELTNTWDNESSFESTSVEQRFDGGTDARGSLNQLNRMLRTQPVSCTVSLGKYEILETFFSANIGKPFYFENVLYVCNTYKWSVLAYGINNTESLVDGVMRFEATFEEVVRP